MSLRRQSAARNHPLIANMSSSAALVIRLHAPFLSYIVGRCCASGRCWRYGCGAAITTITRIKQPFILP